MYFGVLRPIEVYNKQYYIQVNKKDNYGKPKITRTKEELFSDSNQIRYITKGKPDLLLFNESKCSKVGSNITIMYIYSGPDNIQRRNFIRGTYGNEHAFKKYKLVTVFVVGKKFIDDSNILPAKLTEEYNKYGDIVVGDFIETYRNLSWKGLTALNYLNSYCKNAKFVIKADDDTIIDTQGILALLNTSYENRTRFLIGYVRSGGHPKRCKRKHRWCVTKELYPKGYYPPYMLGMGFAYSSDLVSDIYNQALSLPIHPVDDVYITGVLTENIKDKKMYHLGHQFLEDLKGRTWGRLQRGAQIMVGHMKDVRGLEKAWKVIQERYGMKYEIKSIDDHF